MIEFNVDTLNATSIDDFLHTWAEWQFNPSIFTFKNDEAKMTIPKLLYDYLYLTLFDVDILERQRKRTDWTPELEPYYGTPITYNTPFGSFIFTPYK